MAQDDTPAVLYRSEAVRAQGTAWLGETRLRRSAAGSWFAAAAFAAVLAVIAMLVFGAYTRKETALGYLVPTVGLTYVHAGRVGIVERSFVREGDVVLAGDPLLTIAARRAFGDLAGGEMADVDERQLDRLQEDLVAIERQMDAERDLALAARERLEARIEHLRVQELNVESRLADAREHLELREREWQRLSSLSAAGYVAEAVLDEQRALWLGARLQVAAVEGEWQQLRGEAMLTQAELQELPVRLELRLAQLELAWRDVQRTIAEVESRRELVLRAPVSGRVAAFTAHAGMAVSAEQPLLALVPTGSELQAELLVPAWAIGFVQPGQTVRLRYDAFPHAKFGVQPGRVGSVSHAVLSPQQQSGPIRVDAPVFRVQVELESQTVHAYGEAVALQPGLTLQADIVRERRRIVEWLFEPVIALARSL